MKFLIAYLVTAAVFLIIDYIWLGFVAKDFFKNNIGHLMADNINFAVAGIFYLFFAAGIVLFCVMPALDSGSLLKAAMLGAAFGALAYGTYDTTNLATLKDWPAKVAVVDITWGAFITAVSASVGYFITNMVYTND